MNTTRKCVLFLCALFTTITSSFAQDLPPTPNVVIGAKNPDKTAILQLESKTKGFIMPRLTTAERDELTKQSPALGLTIFNIENNCIESWTGEDWVDNCGVTPAEFSITDCKSLAINGTYKQGIALDASNMLELTVNVTKPGTYIINAQPSQGNGYYFNNTGFFSAKGDAKIVIYGLGTPITPTPRDSSRLDTIKIKLNDKISNCYITTAVAANTIPVDFTANCSDVQVYGVAQKGASLNSANYITVKVSGGTLGASYNIATDKVDGVSFSATGKITQDPQVITLTGNTAPTAIGVKNLTIYFNNKDAASPNTTCAVTYTVAYPQLTMFILGTTSRYRPVTGGYSNTMLKSANNFGTTAASTVKSLGINIEDGGNASTATLTSRLTGANKPDIVLTAYDYSFSDANRRTALINYVNAGGVLIVFDEADRGNMSALIDGISGGNSKGNAAGGAGSTYQILNVNDLITNGPFGNVAGLYWGEDASTTNSFSNLPENAIVYSTGAPSNSTTSATAFRITDKNFFYAGDGGFLSWLKNADQGCCYPFAIDADQRPITRPTNMSSGRKPSNAILFGNIMNWAIIQASTNGINPH